MTISIGIYTDEGMLNVSTYRCNTGNLDQPITKDENNAGNLVEVAVYNAIREGVGRGLLPATQMSWNGERFKIHK